MTIVDETRSDSARVRLREHKSGRAFQADDMGRCRNSFATYADLVEFGLLAPASGFWVMC
jgi:hypothetical protein